MFEPSHGGLGGGNSNEDAVLQPFIASLKVEERLDPARYMTGNIELDLHLKESVSLFIWREIEPIIRLYVRQFLPHGPQMDSEHLEEGLDKAFDEYNMRAHRLLLRRTLDGKTVALNEIVKELFAPETDEYSDYRARLRDGVLFRMRDLGLWNVEEEERISKKGNSFHAGYRISAGPALMAFHRLIYVPWTVRQTLFFAAYLSKFQIKGE
jgi:hypothetical protein